jgi:hypothetical protein
MTAPVEFVFRSVSDLPDYMTMPNAHGEHAGAGTAIVGPFSVYGSPGIILPRDADKGARFVITNATDTPLRLYTYLPDVPPRSFVELEANGHGYTLIREGMLETT